MAVGVVALVAAAVELLQRRINDAYNVVIGAC